jgi:hypothetical protein
MVYAGNGSMSWVDFKLKNRVLAQNNWQEVLNEGGK